MTRTLRGQSQALKCEDGTVDLATVLGVLGLHGAGGEGGVEGQVSWSRCWPMEKKPSDDWFRSFARSASNAAGRPSAFVLSVAVVLVWGLSGPLFHFSDTWQLVINTGTTVVTFWMVFVIQSSQNNDTHALQLKLDELIRVTEAARNVFLGCEGLSDEELSAFQSEFNALQKRAQERAAARRPRPR